LSAADDNAALFILRAVVLTPGIVPVPTRFAVRLGAAVIVVNGATLRLLPRPVSIGAVLMGPSLAIMWLEAYFTASCGSVGCS
jgi:hypothetical protein